MAGRSRWCSDGDFIVLDTDKRELSVELSEQELQKRKAQWTAPKPRYTTGVMAKYARLVSSASVGAVTGYEGQRAEGKGQSGGLRAFLPFAFCPLPYEDLSWL